jgi:hypothetical protein
MKTNTMNLSEHPQPENRSSATLSEIKVLRPDGSWKPLAACVALPGQFERTLPRKAIEHFVDRARQSNIALERVIAAIRNSWSN